MDDWAKAVGTQVNGKSVVGDRDPADQQLRDTRLLGRKECFPETFEASECRYHIILINVRLVLAGRFDGLGRDCR